MNKETTPTSSFAIREVDIYFRKWNSLKTKLDALTSPMLENDGTDNKTLKVVLEIMEIIEHGYKQELNNVEPRYFCRDASLKITHDEIRSSFDREG